MNLLYFNKELKPFHLELFTVGNAIDHKKETPNDTLLELTANFESEPVTALKALEDIKKDFCDSNILFDKFWNHIDLEKGGHILDYLLSLPQNNGIYNSIMKGTDSYCLVDNLSIENPKKMIYIINFLKKVALKIKEDGHSYFST